MATRSSMRPPKGGNIKRGVCQNHSYLNPDTGETGDCPKCASGEVQSVNVQRLSDFKCSVCGAKLTPVKSGMSGRTKGLLFGAVGLVLVGGGIFWGHNSGSGGQVSGEGVDTTGIDTVSTIDPQGIDTLTAPDDTQTSDTTTAVAEDPKVQESEKVAKDPEPAPAPSSVLGGVATIEKGNGYTTITFRRDYALDLGKSDGSKLYIQSGDRIERADIRHNVLRGGDFVSRSGENRPLRGLNVKL